MFVSHSSITPNQLANCQRNWDSVQCTQCWWLPYLVMEFEVNQVLITSHGSELGNPLYMCEMHL